MPSSTILSLTGGTATISRVITVFWGSARRARTTATLTLEPGCPCSRLWTSASDISRVLLPSMASKISLAWIPALSAGPPGLSGRQVTGIRVQRLQRAMQRAIGHGGDVGLFHVFAAHSRQHLAVHLQLP